jgi:hypothetical protein
MPLESRGVRPGDPVLLRSIYRGRVRWTFPHRYAGEHDDGRWQHTHVLRFMRPGDAHTVEVYWNEEWSHLGSPEGWDVV